MVQILPRVIMSKQEFYKIKQPQPQKKPDTEKIQDWVWKDNKTKKYQRPKLKPTTYMRGLQISVKGRLKMGRLSTMLEMMRRQILRGVNESALLYTT